MPVVWWNIDTCALALRKHIVDFLTIATPSRNSLWDLITDVKKLRSEGHTIEQISALLGLGNKPIIKYSKVRDFEKRNISQNQH